MVPRCCQRYVSGRAGASVERIEKGRNYDTTLTNRGAWPDRARWGGAGGASPAAGALGMAPSGPGNGDAAWDRAARQRRSGRQCGGTVGDQPLRALRNTGDVMTTIIGIAGSLRQGSFNAALLRA